jgi:hypothetical protein
VTIDPSCRYLVEKQKPDWKDYYLDYKGLKDLIKASAEDADQGASFSPRTTSLTVQRYNNRKDSAEERFFTKLEQEVGLLQGCFVLSLHMLWPLDHILHWLASSIGWMRCIGCTLGGQPAMRTSYTRAQRFLPSSTFPHHVTAQCALTRVFSGRQGESLHEPPGR